MEAGGKITIGSAQYTISSVNTPSKIVTLTSTLSAAAESGAKVSCPYYNSMLGAGWACLTSSNPRGVTAGWTTNEITITADAVLNFETFKCAIKDTDTSTGNASANKVVCDIISFTDMSDPITVDLVSQKGFTIKNNSNDVDVRAVLYRNGEELDEEARTTPTPGSCGMPPAPLLPRLIMVNPLRSHGPTLPGRAYSCVKYQNRTATVCLPLVISYKLVWLWRD